jgi:hypothetical protein
MFWTGANPPFQLQRKMGLSETNWVDFGSQLLTNSANFIVDAPQSFFRVVAVPVKTAP